MNYYAPESSFFPPESEECDFCGEHFSECHYFDGVDPLKRHKADLPVLGQVLPLVILIGCQRRKGK